ncbi:MAG TPA: CocE/NonD family hydrolase [Actinomycetota bacterium]|nr:CocE/NonD family hydrolase [Actinomycetota bacterium]
MRGGSIRRLGAVLAVTLAAGATVALAAAPAGGAPESPTWSRLKAGAPQDYIRMRSKLSAVRYPQTVRETYRLSAADGEKLYVQIVRPDPAQYSARKTGKLPVILEASPYHGTLADRDGTRIFPDPVDASGKKLGLTGYFAPRGYAVAMMDLRGTGRSTGCLDHLGQKDASDLKIVIEWLASQPWSNGRVGMTGHSYVGSTPSVAAAQAPKGLATIVPSAGLASMYDHQFQAGVPYNLQWVGPMYAYEALAIQRDMPPGAPAPPLSSGPTGDNWENKPNPQFGCGMQNSALTAGSGQVTGQYEQWHALRDWSDGAAKANIPIFMVHGVNDNAARIPAAEWFFADRGMRAGDKVWIGQWDHGSTNGRCGGIYGFRVLHPTCRFDQFQYALHAWFDKHLMRRNVDTGPAVEVFLNGRAPMSVTQVVHPEKVGGPVFTAKGWGSPDAIQSLYLDASDMSLDFAAPAAPASKTFGTTANGVLAHVGQGTLTFESEPLAQDTLFLGVPEMQLNASVSTGQIQHLTVTLLRKGQNAEGATVREPMNYCAIQPQLRNGVKTVAPVIPGQEMGLDTQCFTMAHWVPAGQSLVVEVSTRTPHHATFGSDRNITIYTGPEKSHYSLPIASGARLYNDVRLHETYPVEPPPGPAQPGIEGQVVVPAPGAGNKAEPITAAGFEFDIKEGYDNARMDILATPLTPADLDLYLQKQADGGWTDITAGESGDLDKEVLTAGRLPTGHYRVLVHNWAGGPTLTDLEIAFFNRDGQEGGSEAAPGEGSLELLATNIASGYLPQA